MTRSKKQKKSKKKGSVVILFGPPGAGKGTQGELLSEKLNLYYLETSKLIEDCVMNAKKGEYMVVDGKRYYFDKERENWKQGILCSPPFVTGLVIKKIKELALEGKGILMSGSPRTVFEAQKEVPLLKKLYGKDNIKVILIEISPEETLWRNSHRRICKLMRHPILYTKETKDLKICPLDGSPLLKREGLDDPETIKVRLKEYKQRTFPLLQYFKKQKIKVKKVNGEGTVEEVFKRILEALDIKYDYN